MDKLLLALTLVAAGCLCAPTPAFAEGAHGGPPALRAVAGEKTSAGPTLTTIALGDAKPIETTIEGDRLIVQMAKQIAETIGIDWRCLDAQCTAIAFVERQQAPVQPDPRALAIALSTPPNTTLADLNPVNHPSSLGYAIGDSSRFLWPDHHFEKLIGTSWETNPSRAFVSVQDSRSPTARWLTWRQGALELWLEPNGAPHFESYALPTSYRR